MNNSNRSRMAIFAIGFCIALCLTGYYFAERPHHLLTYVWPMLEAQVFASNSYTADSNIHGPGGDITAQEFIDDWKVQDPDDYAQLMSAFIWSPLAGTFAGILLLWLVGYLDSESTRMHHIRGRYLASQQNVSVAARRLYGKGSIMFDSLHFPELLEAQGLLFSGATGAGKTTAIMACLSIAIARQDRVIVTDQNGVLMAHYQPSNNILLLNPFDARTKNWSLLAEMKSIYDAPRLAKSTIPDAVGAESKQWTMYAQQMLSAVLERLYLQGNATNADLLRYFRPEGQADLRSLLSGKTASALFIPGNERLAANVGGVLGMYLSPHEYLDPQAGATSFSITRWIKEDHFSWLWLTYMEDQLDALRPLIATWLDIASSAATSLSQVKRPAPGWQFWKKRVEPRRIWNVIDEAASIGRIQSLEHSITVGRKAGLRTVIGIQSVSQLRELYGTNCTETILGSLKSAVIFNTEDPDTSEYLSKRVGDAEVELTSTSSGRAAHEFGNSHFGQNTHQTIRRVVLPSEISALPNLNAYVVLSGVSAVARIKLMPRELLTRIPTFIAKTNPPVPLAPTFPSVSSAPIPPKGPEFV